MRLPVALRRLIQSPGFTTVGVLSLALGIGGNLALLSILNATLWVDLPFKDSSRIVRVYEGIGRGSVGGLSYLNYLDLQRENHVFSDMSPLSNTDFTVVGAGLNGRFGGELVMPDYFKLLGAGLSAGRLFGPDEPAVVVSHALWQKSFHGSNTILGKTLRIGDALLPIVGVAAPGFRGYGDDADLWVPLAIHHQLYSQIPVDFLKERDIHWLLMLGHLKPGYTVDSVRTNFDPIMQRLAKEFPEANKDRSSVAAAYLRDDQMGSARKVLWLIAGAGAFLFLITAANVANLVLIRASRRRQETAVRLALGASTQSIRRSFLVESLLLSSAGAAIGLVLALASSRLILSVLPVEIPDYARPVFDVRILAIGLAMTLFAALLLAIAPAWGKLGLSNDWFSSRGASATQTAQRARIGFVIVQTALATTLLFGAVQMTRSLWKLEHQDLGFRAEGLVSVQFQSPSHYLGAEARIRFGEKLATEAANLPGVEKVALTAGDPLSYIGINRGFMIAGREAMRGEETEPVRFMDISSNYLETLGIPLLRGRSFTDHDDLNSQAVAIVTESFAKAYFKDGEALGQRVKYMPKDAPWMTIVGIAKDAKLRNILQPSDTYRSVFVPLRQEREAVIELALIARTRVPPSTMVDPIRRLTLQADPETAVLNALPLSDRLARQQRSTRNLTWLLECFAGLAAFLAALGVAGVLANLVSARLREIGIRMAVGATRAQIVRLVAVNAAWMITAGTLAGLGLSFWQSRLLHEFAFGLSDRDFDPFFIVATLILAVGVLAAWIPARTATRVDPAAMLRRDN